MTKDELLGYAAGYVDGDGCVTVITIRQVSGTVSFRPILEIGSKVKRIIEYLQGVLGPGRISNERDGTFRLRYNYGDATKVLERLSPYLYLKRRQADLTIQMNALTSQWQCRKKLPESMRAEREELRSRIRALNFKPEPFQEHAPRAKKRSFSYFAGILDSEGCLRIEQKGIELSPIVHVAMTDGFVSQWLKDTFGGYVITLDCGSHKTLYRWGAERNVAVSCLKKALPYLKSKREQAEVLIRLQNHKDLWHRKMNGKPLPESVILKRQAWKARVNHLNQSAGAEAKPTQPSSVSDGPIYQDGKLVELPLAATA